MQLLALIWSSMQVLLKIASCFCNAATPRRLTSQVGRPFRSRRQHVPGGELLGSCQEPLPRHHPGRLPPRGRKLWQAETCVTSPGGIGVSAGNGAQTGYCQFLCRVVRTGRNTLLGDGTSHHILAGLRGLVYIPTMRPSMRLLSDGASCTPDSILADDRRRAKPPKGRVRSVKRISF